MNHQISGLHAWTVQRLSAIYLALFSIAATAYFVYSPLHDYADWHRLWTHPLVSIAAALVFIALLVHIWVGVRDVLLDYVRPPLLRFALLALLWGWCLALGLWLLRILVRTLL